MSIASVIENVGTPEGNTSTFPRDNDNFKRNGFHNSRKGAIFWQGGVLTNNGIRTLLVQARNMDPYKGLPPLW
jgi:hypothetical protein